jgi:hypothetical protein
MRKIDSVGACGIIGTTNDLTDVKASCVWFDRIIERVQVLSRWKLEERRKGTLHSVQRRGDAAGAKCARLRLTVVRHNRDKCMHISQEFCQSKVD